MRRAVILCLLLAVPAFGAPPPVVTVVAPPSVVPVGAPLRVVAFAGASNLPLWAGQEHGLFAGRGIAVTLDITPNSVELARNLDAGRYDLALTSVDNVVAYDEGQGEAGLGAVDFVALFGVDDGMLSLVAAQRIGSIEALQCVELSVDAGTTGFAFALREMLARAGLPPPRLVRVGGGAQRLAGLLAGAQEATLLNTPLDIIAARRGFRALARVTDRLGPYQGIVAAVRRDRIGADHDRLVAFTAAFHDSVAWLAVHPAEGAALLAAHMGMEPEVARAAYAALLDPAHGIRRDLAIDPAGMATVLSLRSTYAAPHRALTDAGRYVDDAVRAEALR